MNTDSQVQAPPAYPTVRRALVLGGGSAGFLAAITLKKRIPWLDVRVLRSKELGIIGVGEGTTTTVPYHLHQFLGLPIDEFYAVAEPIWKLGIRFEWGPRPHFHYVFGFELDTRHRGLSKGTGHYVGDADTDGNADGDDGRFDHVGYPSALMTHNRVFYRLPDGRPRIDPDELALHIENEKLVQWLEGCAARLGIGVADDTVVEVLKGEVGVTGLRLASGGVATADLFVDCSGFHALLVGKALEEPYVDFRRALFCDRAVVGGWARGDDDEPIKPYTTAETMLHGWCWQIEHEHRINRGYVYASAFCADDDAEREFRAKNPKVERTRIVRFNSGHVRRGWVKNVVAVGNAAGFVEPLEATALASICVQCQSLAESLADGDGRVRPALVDCYNLRSRLMWESTRDFLAVHYKFNRRPGFDTPYWRACHADTDIGAAREIVDYYVENGPSGLWRVPLFEGTNYLAWGMEGYFAMLVGMSVPYRRTYRASEAELTRWRQVREAFRAEAQRAYTVREALELVRRPDWTWPAGLYQRPQGIGIRR